MRGQCSLLGYLLMLVENMKYSLKLFLFHSKAHLLIPEESFNWSHSFFFTDHLAEVNLGLLSLFSKVRWALS